MAKVRVKQERNYSPHHTLLGAAETNLKLAKEKQSGCFHFEMAAMLFSGLALEALANAFGHRLVTNWKDFESASPIAKLRIVCETLGIYQKEDAEPWTSARWLISFRNKLAHAKPEDIRITDDIDLHAWEARDRTGRPGSKLEKEVSLGNAERAVNAANAIMRLLCSKLDVNNLSGLAVEHWTTRACSLGEASESN